MSNLNLLTNSRKYIRGQVTRHHNSRDSFITKTISEKHALKAKFKSYLNDLKDHDIKIQALQWQEDESSTKLNDELATCESYTDKLIEMLALLEESVPVTSTAMDAARTLLKSPTAPLPIFSSIEGENIEKFLKEFEDTTDSFQLKDRDKLLLLKQQVSGRASILLSSLEVDKQTYKDAKELLLAALASGSLQKFNIIKQITEMKLTYNTDPFSYVSQMKNCIESVKLQKIGTDDFLNYFFWHGLNDTFKNQLTIITNQTRPSLDEIKDKFFEAAERYALVTKNYNSRNHSKGFGGKPTTNLATNVNFNKPNGPSIECTLCALDKERDFSHPIYKCRHYDSARAKVDKLKEIGGCLKCAKTNHSTEACNFKFRKKCFHCGKWHFSYLCVNGNEEQKRVPSTASTEEATSVTYQNQKVPKKGKNAKAIAKDEVSSGMILSVGALRAISTECILPTFTCYLSNQTEIRCLVDCGSQTTFVTEALVKANNLKVLKKNVNLTVNGFNSSKQYITKLVEVNVEVGDMKYKVEALCVPSIDINLKLPQLSRITKTFIEKGYVLADMRLLDNQEVIDNIDLIVGTNNMYCIMSSMVGFGQPIPSIYSQCDLGVMLMGNVQNMISNLKYLPDLRCALSGDSNSDSSPDLMAESSVVYVGFGSSILCEDPIFAENEVVHEIKSNFAVLKDDGSISESELNKAANEIVRKYDEKKVLDYDQVEEEDSSSEVNEQLIRFALNHAVRNEDGRLSMPLLWNSKVSHLLGRNYNLAKAVLQSNFRKLKKNKLHLHLMDDAIKEQEELGIIQRIPNLDQYMNEHPEHSFLPHMGVFKLDRDTTKCRVVFLSNICERDLSKPATVSHNQSIHSGPCLNHKIASALLHLRFGSMLLCFDIKKAFNQIELNPSDQNRLLFLWGRNVKKGDFSLVGYRNVRLSFGLRCSPTILMLCLYKILVLDTEGDSEEVACLKRLIYQLFYMDNGAFACKDSSTLKWAYQLLPSIFEPFKMELQQIVTNDVSLQECIDAGLDNKTDRCVKLLGLRWQREEDTLSTRPIVLDGSANTKRLILKSIASNFDLYNFNGPVFNRSRVFMHGLQCDKSLGWDDPLSQERMKEWRCISKQANATPEIKIKRFVGERDASYRLLSCVDASSLMYGAVLYVENMDTGEVSFVMAKNRMVNTNLKTKSIPSLELQAISLGTEMLLELYKELSGPTCIMPIRVEALSLYSDSLVALTWVNSYACKLEKMQGKSNFVLNRLHHINQLCEIFPVNFSFTSGQDNPGDCITRCLSYKQLMKTNYFSGPKIESKDIMSSQNVLNFTLPNPLFKAGDESDEIKNASNYNIQCDRPSLAAEHLISPSRYSDFRHLVGIHAKVLRYWNKWKARAKLNRPVCKDLLVIESGYHKEAIKHIILKEQQINFPEIFNYFESDIKRIKDIPILVGQLNVYPDQVGILRVRSKCDRWKNGERCYFPILLHKNSELTKLIILDLHIRLKHAGCYSLLAELRKEFWVPHYFSVVKKILKDCVTCKRYNGRPVKLNQSPYRDFRLHPSETPFGYVYIDYFGPYTVKQEHRKFKVWVFCITCMFTRALNLKVCVDMSVREFLRSFMLHSFDYGLPQFCVSDLGSQIVAGGNIIMDFLKDPETQQHFEEAGVKPIKFDQYFKGCSQMGSLVEICVKLVKHLINKSIGTNILEFRDFEFLIGQACHLVNRRPISYKEALRDSNEESVPHPITPEKLLHGYDLLSINVIPDLQPDPEIDPEYLLNTTSPEKISNIYEKLKKVRKRLIDNYHSEFLATLVKQAVDKKDRYLPCHHETLKLGDLVLIKDTHLKPLNYPMGRIKEIIKNSNGEVTNAVVLKGKSGELVKRHVTSLIPLLTTGDVDESNLETNEQLDVNLEKGERSRRRAAVESEKKTRQLLEE